MHRHLGLVYGVALRLVRDRAIAEEVTQSVFVELGQKAHKLGDGTILPAWLHEVARRKAIDAYRREQRRLQRESSAMQQVIATAENRWEELAPIIDHGLAALGRTDQTALVLRYLKGETLREVAAALNITEDAAQKRVSRALDRLRRVLVRQGASIGATALGTALSSNAVVAPPLGLAEVIILQSLKSVAGSVSVGGWLSTACMSTTGKALVATVLMAVAGSGIYQVVRSAKIHSRMMQLEESHAAALRDLAETTSLLQNREVEIADLLKDNEDLHRDRLDLMRLRNEIGTLRARIHASNPRINLPLDDTSDAFTEPIKSWINRVKDYKS